MKHALKEPLATLRKIKGNASLLPVYAGVLAGARKSMDDWIPVQAIDAFLQFARSLDLAVAEDCIFEPLKPHRKIDSLDRSPTTHAYGLPLRDRHRASPEASVHVFLSRKRAWAEEALASSTYPVAIADNRLLIRPRIDASRLGLAFGYPACCVDSFQKRNNWHLRSHFSHAYRAAGTVDWRANCLPRSTPFMTLFHVPCASDCAESIRMSQQILEAVGSFDPLYREAIEASLKGIFLIVHEAVVYKLHDAAFEKSGAVTFSKAVPVVPLRKIRPPQIAKLTRIVEAAQWLELVDGIITTRNGSEDFYELDPTAVWVEEPCLVSFA